MVVLNLRDGRNEEENENCKNVEEKYAVKIKHKKKELTGGIYTFSKQVQQ